MLSGMRLDEACQLYKEDIREVDGIWCIDINDSKDKKLKNLASRRVIPVHPKLISLGFIDYVNNCNDQRLWMNLRRRYGAGYGFNLGQWFGKFNRQYVTPDLLKTFHSLRHAFTDNLKQQGIEKTFISELLGHAVDDQSMGRYGKSYRPEVLLEVIRKVDYGI
jgi:integrase